MRYKSLTVSLLLAAVALFLFACATTSIPPGARTVELKAPGCG